MPRMTTAAPDLSIFCDNCRDYHKKRCLALTDLTCGCACICTVKSPRIGFPPKHKAEESDLQFARRQNLKRALVASGVKPYGPEELEALRQAGKHGRSVMEDITELAEKMGRSKMSVYQKWYRMTRGSIPPRVRRLRAPKRKQRRAPKREQTSRR